MGSVLISVEELEKAAEAFDGEFSSGKMNDKIHRFPAGLRDVGDRYIVPMVVAIGPYHRASNHLKKMEEVKHAAAFQFSKGWQGNPPLKQVQDAVLSVADDARKLYAGDAVVGMGNHDFAAMMFLDACFLLQYMEAYPSFRSNKEPTVDEGLRRFLFTNRACINNDIMLLENQLPWLVLQTVINSLSAHKNYMGVVKRFIQDMGDTFKIDADLKKHRSAVSNNYSSSPPPPPPAPRHLLWLGVRRRHKTESSINNSSPPPPPPPPSPPLPPHLLGLLRQHKTEGGTIVKWPQVDRISAFSAIELAEIGIKLKASETAMFTEMDVRKRGPLCGELSLAPLSLSDTRACWLVNMAAFEVSTASTFRDDDPNRTAVCSYLALLSMFMPGEEDVDELRSKRILHGHRTNAEMLTFFKGVVKLLPDTGCRFTHIMVATEDYKASRRIRTKAHKFVYSNLWTIIQVVTIIGTLLGIFQALLSLNQGQKKDAPGQYLSLLAA